MPTTAAGTVWFTSKGQVVIPAKLRRQFNIQNGTRAVVTSTAEGILLKPVTREYISSLRGSLKGKGVLKALAEDRKREQDK
jgi:AbrB family looped-hinge helix DNA binding protein